MGRLLLEIRAEGRWATLGEVSPGDDGSLSHNPFGGERKIYRFRCFDDHSLIEQSIGGVDSELGPLRAITTIGFEQVARLDATNPSLEVFLRTDKMRSPQRFRWRHDA